MVAEKNPYIKKATGILYELSQDEQIRLQEEYRERARRDYVAGLKSSRIDGYKEGVLEGALLRQTEIAIQMLKASVPIEIITNCTGFSPEELRQLREETARMPSFGARRIAGENDLGLSAGFTRN